MLQIKNTLGGGKPEGLYAWKKNNYAFTEKSTSGMTANTFITTEAQNKSIKYYYSSSYSHDDNTGLFVLENPTSGTVPYDSGISPPANVYVTVFSPSSEIMIKTSSTSGKSTLYNVSTGVYFHITNANYPYTLFKSEITLSFLDYIVSDKETAYPDGGEKGGYWYERVVDGLDVNLADFDCTMYETGEITSASESENLTINHSLGVKPTYIILYNGTKTGSYYVNDFVAVSASSSNTGSKGALNTSQGGNARVNGYTGSASFDKTRVTLSTPPGVYQYFRSGATYKYLIIA